MWKNLTSGALRGSGKKALVAPDGTTLAVLDLYCYVARLGSSQLLVWFIEPRRRNAADPASMQTMHFAVFDVDRLQPITDPSAACQEIDAKGLCMVAAGGDVAHFAAPADLSEGLHRLAFPESMCVMDELLFLCHSRQVSLWIVRPRDNTIEVFPQDWFNNGNFDFGYQWPTRVAKDPGTGQIFGDGIRIGAFVLDASNRRIDRWLDR